MKILLCNRLRSKISKGARERAVREFSIEAGVRKYVDVYMNLRS